MIEGVPRDRAERLDLAGRGQPAAHGGSRMAAPALYLDGHVHGPQYEGLQDADKHVVARIQQLYQLIQSSDPLRRRRSLRVEGLPQHRERR